MFDDIKWVTINVNQGRTHFDLLAPNLSNLSAPGEDYSRNGHARYI